jgi:predicted O-methyltransferase YrrM
VLDGVRSDRVAAADVDAVRAVEQARWQVLRSPAIVGLDEGVRVPVSRICAAASQPPVGARLLYHAVAVWSPDRAVELGTCVGVSAAYQALGIDPARSRRLTTVERHADLVDHARRLWAAAGVHGIEAVVGRFDTVLDLIEAGGPVDYAYVDGHHDGAATIRYVDRLAAARVHAQLVVVDDIDYSSSMRTAWHELRRRSDASASADLGKIGLMVLS